MKNLASLIAIVFLLFSLASSTSAQIIFYEDFSNGLSDWIVFGSPLPRIVDVHGKSSVFDNNGDSVCESGAISNATIDISGGVQICADIYLDVYDLSGCWATINISLTNGELTPPGGACGGSDYKRWTLISFEMIGDACWVWEPSLRRHCYFRMAGIDPILGDSYVNGWHKLRVIIRPDAYVEAYVDNYYLGKSGVPIDAEYLDNPHIYLGDRSSGYGGKAYIDNITVSNPIFYEDFSDGLADWDVFGSPLPQVVDVHGATDVFDNNGDSWCESGAVSKDSLGISDVVEISADVYLQVDDLSGCWANAKLCLTTGDYIGSGQCLDYDEWIVVGFNMVGEACWGWDAELRGHSYLGGTNLDIVEADSFTNGWHKLRAIINKDRYVDAYIDNFYIGRSSAPIDLKYLHNSYVYLGDRSAGVGGKAYIDNFAIFSLGTESPVATFFDYAYGEVFDSGIKIFWNTQFKEEIMGYYIYRSKGDNEKKPISSLISSSENCFIDYGAEPGYGYDYNVVAIKDNSQKIISEDIYVYYPIPELNLFQNYPNPFNPCTKISYYLPERSKVRLSVYDATGRLIRKLVDDYQDKGSYEVLWDGKDSKGYRVSSGVYFYSLHADKRVITKKMVLIR